MRVFIDSDVVISSLLPSSGAALLLLNQSTIKPVISSISFKELRIVINRISIEPEKLEVLIKNRFEVFPINKKLEKIKEEYIQFVGDVSDAHIVAGAHEAKIKYIISYQEPA